MDFYEDQSFNFCMQFQRLPRWKKTIKAETSLEARANKNSDVPLVPKILMTSDQVR